MPKGYHEGEGGRIQAPSQAPPFSHRDVRTGPQAYLFEQHHAAVRSAYAFTIELQVPLDAVLDAEESDAKNRVVADEQALERFQLSLRPAESESDLKPIFAWL